MKVTMEMVIAGCEAASWLRTSNSTCLMRDILQAALADVPEPGSKELGPFVLSENERNCKEFIEGTPGHGPLSATGKVLAEALDRAVRTLAPAQEPGPFVLLEMEHKAVQYVKDQYADSWLNVVLDALDRAVRTLGPREAPVPTGDVLTAEEREQVEALRSTVVIPGSTKARVIAVVDRIAPKPVEKTNEELAALVTGSTSWDECREALATLVRRANGAGK